MRFLNKLSIRNKILLLACIGCAGLLFNLAFNAFTSLTNEGRLTAVREVHFPILEDTDHAIAALEDLDEHCVRLSVISTSWRTHRNSFG